LLTLFCFQHLASFQEPHCNGDDNAADQLDNDLAEHATDKPDENQPILLEYSLTGEYPEGANDFVKFFPHNSPQWHALGVDAKAKAINWKQVLYMILAGCKDKKDNTRIGSTA